MSVLRNAWPDFRLYADGDFWFAPAGAPEAPPAAPTLRLARSNLRLA